MTIDKLKHEAEKKRKAIIRRAEGLAEAIDDLEGLTAEVTQAEGPQSAYRYKGRYAIIYPVGHAIKSMLNQDRNL